VIAGMTGCEEGFAVGQAITLGAISGGGVREGGTGRVYSRVVAAVSSVREGAGNDAGLEKNDSALLGSSCGSGEGGRGRFDFRRSAAGGAVDSSV
jgi:hypothetical protein